MASELVQSARTDSDLRENQDRPARLPRDTGWRELIVQAFAQDAVGLSGEFLSVLFENPSVEEHYGLRVIACANSGGPQLRHVHNSRSSGRSCENKRSHK